MELVHHRNRYVPKSTKRDEIVVVVVVSVYMMQETIKKKQDWNVAYPLSYLFAFLYENFYCWIRKITS